MDGNGCSIGTHILSYKPLFGIELLFKENKTNNKGDCYGCNDQKQDCQSMLLASFT